MKFWNKHVVVASIASAALLTGGPATAASKKEQNDAIIACKDERGIPGPFATNVTWRFGQGTVVKIRPHAAVTPEDAVAINACAAARLGLRANAGQSTARPGVESDEYAGTSKYGSTTARAQNGARGFVGSICQRRSLVMVGGSQYCDVN